MGMGDMDMDTIMDLNEGGEYGTFFEMVWRQGCRIRNKGVIYPLY